VNSVYRPNPPPLSPGALLSLTPEADTQSANRGPRVPKILVVDDNVVVLKTISIKLKSEGYEVRTAMDGSTAVSCVRREKPDLIILDINFPPDTGSAGNVSWDGFMILDWLRRIEEARDTPIIFITSGESAKFRQRALDAGAIAFFEKPVNHEEMMNVIRHTLGDPPSFSPPPAT